METLAENWFFVLILLLCIGSHFFGHGHGHGHDSRHEHQDTNERHNEPR